MGSNSRHAKAIDVGFRKATSAEGGRASTHALPMGATPLTDAPQERGSSLPAWMNERYADASKSIPRQAAERPDSSEELMTVLEAASVLRISERTLRRHLAEGRIPHIRAGKQIRILPAALLGRWIISK
jgi:excisionase family DNA binding protein